MWVSVFGIMGELYFKKNYFYIFIFNIKINKKTKNLI